MSCRKISSRLTRSALNSSTPIFFVNGGFDDLVANLGRSRRDFDDELRAGGAYAGDARDLFERLDAACAEDS